MTEPGQPTVRFEALVQPRDPDAGGRTPIDDLDIDRIPDPAGQSRAVVDLETCQRLVDQGYEVRLQRALPVRPLQARLVAEETTVEEWYERRTGRRP